MGLLRDVTLKVSRRERLREEIADEVRHLRARYDLAALSAAWAKLQDQNLTTWGRLIVKGAIMELTIAEAKVAPERRSWSR